MKYTIIKKEGAPPSQPPQNEAQNTDGRINFLAPHPDLEALQNEFRAAEKLIRDALRAEDLIILRHHADADGYCAAMALEEALIPLVQKTRTKVWHGFRRQPCKAPLYDYGDALRDLDAVKEEQLKNRNVLFIFADLASGEESVLALRRIKQHGAKIMVIDHHPPAPEIDEICDLHLNPHTKGRGSDACAGILCAEIAHLLAPRLAKELVHLAAIAAVSDRSNIPDYGKKQPLSEQELEKIGICIDFEAAMLRFTDSDSIKDTIFNKPGVVDLIFAELETRKRQIETVAKKYAHSRTISLGGQDVQYITLDVENTMISDYPGNKILSIAHRLFSGPRVSVGIRSDMVTFRADGIPEEVFSFRKLMDSLKETLPHAAISGGGHAAAGTIRFVPAAKEEVLQEIRRYLRLS